MMSKFRLWGFIIIVLLTGTAFLMGTLVSQPEAQARIVTVPEPVIQEVPVYVEKVVHEPHWIFEEVPVYVQKIEYVEVPAQLKPFQSWRELQVWLANNFVRDAILGRCVDTALELCQRAWRDGYQMSPSFGETENERDT